MIQLHIEKLPEGLYRVRLPADRGDLMGKVAGFGYRDFVKRPKALGLEFHRLAAGSHELWFNPALSRYTTIPNHPRDMPEGTPRAILKQAGVEADAFLSTK